jgi:hypothetical protein
MATISGTVRVAIPAKVAANIKTLKSTLENIAERLGCRPCFSGADCFFELEKNYVVDEKAKLATSLQVPQVLARGFPSRAASNTVNVVLSNKAGYNIGTITAAVEKIAELSGHTACATGCNLFFQHFLDDMRSFAVNERGLIQKF